MNVSTGQWKNASCSYCGLKVTPKHKISDSRKRPNIENLHLGRLLGKGSNGVVYSAVNQTTGTVYALKGFTGSVEPDLINGRNLYKEMSKRDNPNLAKLLVI